MYSSDKGFFSACGEHYILCIYFKTVSLNFDYNIYIFMYSIFKYNKGNPTLIE